MEKVDRLGWAAGVSVRCYGVKVGVRTNDRETLQQIVDLLPPGWTPADGPVDMLYSILNGDAGKALSGRRGMKRFHLLYGMAARIARTHYLREALEIFRQEVQLLVAQMTRTRAFLHCGAVRWKGRAILVPGESGSGKSSLTAELVRAGAQYYSDEYAILDGRGRVHPYHLPLSLDEPDTDAWDFRPVSVEDLGGRKAISPAPVGLVLLTQYREGARWRPRAQTNGRGVLALMGHAVGARYRPSWMMQCLRSTLKPALVLKGVRGEASDIAPLALERLEQHVGSAKRVAAPVQ